MQLLRPGESQRESLQVELDRVQVEMQAELDGVRQETVARQKKSRCELVTVR